MDQSLRCQPLEQQAGDGGDFGQADGKPQGVNVNLRCYTGAASSLSPGSRLPPGM